MRYSSIFAILAIALSPLPAAAQTFLTAEQLANLFPDAEVAHVSPKSGSNVYVIFKDGGTIGGWVGAKKRKLTGVWHIEPRGTICFDIQPLNDKFCFYLTKSGDQMKRFNARKKPMPGIDWTLVKPGKRAHLVTE